MDAHIEKLIDDRLDEMEKLGFPIKANDTRERVKQRLRWLEENKIPICQSYYEIADVYGALAGKQHENYVEIGVATGGTLWMSALAVKPGGLILGVDNYCDSDRNNARNKSLALKVVKELDKTHRVRLLTHGPSVELVEEVVGHKRIRGRGIDHLHIDGLHTYAGVKGDFEAYYPYVKESGLVQFHDIITTNPSKEGPCGAPEYWAELKERYPGRCREVIQPGASIFGIGLLRKPKTITGTSDEKGVSDRGAGK